MKIRNSNGGSEKIEPRMAPMIDVVFQLLIFFMLTLKILEPEGDFTVNIPQGKPAPISAILPNILPKTVKLVAKPDGSLRALSFGAWQFPIRPETDVANIQQYIILNPNERLTETEAAWRLGEDVAFRQLTARVEKWVRSQRGGFPNSKGEREEFEKAIKIRIHFPYSLHNRYIVKATSACRGRIVQGQDRPIDLVKNIEFNHPTMTNSATAKQR